MISTILNKITKPVLGLIWKKHLSVFKVSLQKVMLPRPQFFIRMTIQVSIKKEKKKTKKKETKEGNKKDIFCQNLFACASSIAYQIPAKRGPNSRFVVVATTKAL